MQKNIMDFEHPTQGGTHYNMARTKAFHAFGIFLYLAQLSA